MANSRGMHIYVHQKAEAGSVTCTHMLTCASAYTCRYHKQRPAAEAELVGGRIQQRDGQVGHAHAYWIHPYAYTHARTYPPTPQPYPCTLTPTHARPLTHTHTCTPTHSHREPAPVPNPVPLDLISLDVT